MKSLFLIVTIDGEHVALPTENIESVVEIDEIEPVPLAPSHVAGLFALRSRVMTVIDSVASINPDRRFAWDGHAEAVIVTCDGHGYAILVENVDDVAESDGGVTATRAVLQTGWARVASGAIDIDGENMLVVDPQALVLGQMASLAA